MNNLMRIIDYMLKNDIVDEDKLFNKFIGLFTNPSKNK